MASSLDDFNDEVHRVAAALLRVSPSKRPRLLKKEARRIENPEVRESLICLVAMVTRVMEDAGNGPRQRRQDWAAWLSAALVVILVVGVFVLPERRFLALFGVVFIALLVLLALFVKEPTRFQEGVFRIVVALAASALGAVLPGFLDIEGAVLDLTIRAGGALGLFVFVYWINPGRFVAARNGQP